MNDHRKDIAALLATRDSAGDDVDEMTAVAPPLVPGYDVGDLIGRGGMGDVYRARDRDLDREVAVKILQERYAVASPTAARFLEEARITGQLQHPGIPAVYRVSQLADGRPFLAMKLVKGQTLDDLLKGNAPINHLAVIEAVAQAVGYAHAHDVIHRDLKPQNIMVGAFGEVQVMDWGLAKVLSASGGAQDDNQDPEATTAGTLIRTTRDSDYTQAGSVLGTPAYMPPEQAAGETNRIGKASDVFGLGAVWCKLLTGEAPFVGADAESIRRNALRGKTEEALARLDASGMEPEVLALCKRCLAVEPEDRPADANEVAEAVAMLRVEAETRARQAEVSRARAEVEAGEHAKRRRLVQRAALAVAAVLLLGLLGTGVGLWRADAAMRKAIAAEQDADAKRVTAEEETALANEVKEFLRNDVLQLANPRIQQQEGAALKYDADLRLRDVVLRAADKIEGKFKERPKVEAEIRKTLGHTLLAMGRADLGAKQLERALQLCKSHFGPGHPETHWMMSKLAHCYATLGRPAEAQTLIEELLALQQKEFGPDHPEVLMSMNNLANCLEDRGRLAEAFKLREETLTLRKAKLGPDHEDTLLSMNNLASSFAALGRHADALRLHQETLALRKAKLGVDNPQTLWSMYNSANSLASLGRHPEALKLHEDALVLRKAKLGPDHPDTLCSMNTVGNGFAALGRQADALKLREETLSLRKVRLGRDHPDTLWSMNNLAGSYELAGRHAEAQGLYEETLALRKTKLGPDHPDTLWSMHYLANLHLRVGRPAEALKLSEETLALRKVKLGGDHPDTLSSEWSALRALMTLKRFAEALPRIEALTKAADEVAAAGKRCDPMIVPAMSIYRARIHRESKDLNSCRAAAEQLESRKLVESPGAFYNRACLWAVVAAAQAEAKTEESSRLAVADADKAMHWLQKAVAAGWRDSFMQQDPDLESLRGRDDFKKLMANLPK